MPTGLLWTGNAYSGNVSHEEADWKRQRGNLLDWLTAGITLGFVAVFLYLGLTGDALFFLLSGVGLFVWLLVFFSRYWEAVLYVPATVLVTAVSVVWILRGAWTRPLVQVVIVMTGVYVMLTSFLLVYEDPRF